MVDTSHEFIESRFTPSTYTNQENKVQRQKGKSLLELPDDYTIVDIETTGLSLKYSEIIEVALIKIRNNQIAEKFESLVKPATAVNDVIIKLTGISNDMLINAPSINLIVEQIKDFIGTDIVIAHNANFDINFLYDSFLNHLNVELSNDFVDTLRISRKAFSEYPKHTLSYLCDNIPIAKGGMHRAMCDCLVTFELYKICKDKILNENISLPTTKNSYHKSTYINTTQILVQDESVIDEESLLYGNECVFTGSLTQMSRSEAMQYVVNIGGLVKNRISKDTKYLIMGIQDYAVFTDGKESSKTKKAKELISSGCNINIISEEEFYKIIFNKEKSRLVANHLNPIEERLLELNCGIINILDNKVEIHGFLSEERLNDYLQGINCRYSYGVYPLNDFNETLIQDNALFIIKKNNIESHRVQLTNIYEDIVILKMDGKNLNRKIKIRKSTCSGDYQLIINKEHINFTNLDELTAHFDINYNYDLSLKLINRTRDFLDD